MDTLIDNVDVQGMLQYLNGEGFTEHQLAAVSDLSQSTINLTKNGKHDPGSIATRNTVNIMLFYKEYCWAGEGVDVLDFYEDYMREER